MVGIANWASIASSNVAFYLGLTINNGLIWRTRTGVAERFTPQTYQSVIKKAEIKITPTIILFEQYSQHFLPDQVQITYNGKNGLLLQSFYCSSQKIIAFEGVGRDGQDGSDQNFCRARQ